MKWGFIILVFATLVALTCGSLVGGIKEVKLEENEGAREALRAAVEEHNKRSNCVYLSKVLEVKKVEVQVVEGILYRITVIMAKTPCRKGRTLEMCSSSSFKDTKTTQPYECTFKVWSRPWLENRTEVEQDCSQENYVGKESV